MYNVQTTYTHILFSISTIRYRLNPHYN